MDRSDLAKSELDTERIIMVDGRIFGVFAMKISNELI